ncbi:MAG: ribosome-recycling factor [Microcystis aeruginosa Ma_MB_F_20061100_S19]|nr:MAG: ribosome-recycling factor [Microcystis aeruginosa Ma_MB_F_20061100_S19]TRU11411.1 MAG: ribosome-recycling factor [Microcystis aeruginosa Ma_MB_F_20061100_S19D]
MIVCYGGNCYVSRGNISELPRINILAMAKSLTEPELKQYNTNELLDTKS